MSIACGAYSLIQLVPNMQREEGLNVGIVLLDETRRWIDVRTLEDPADLEFVVRRLGCADRLPWLARDLPALATRLRRDVNPLTMGGLRHFGACEATWLELRPPHAIALDGGSVATLDRLFRDLVTVQRTP